MAKTELKPNTVLMPVPVVLVTVAGKNDRANIITLAWVGTVSSVPPMISISIRPSRFSHDLIKKSGDFVANIPSEDLILQTDGCGSISGRDVYKFDHFNLTPEKATQVKAPLIKECSVSMECRVKHMLELGSHDMFVAEIIALHADENVLSGGKIDASKVKPLAYAPHDYWSLKDKIGTYGFSQKT